MKFTEEWYSPAGIVALRKAYGRTDGLEGRIIEVGCWEGRSTVALARACYPEMLHAVDTWEGSPGEPSETLAAERDVYAQFQANIDMATAGNVIVHRMGWRDYFTTDQTPIRFLHIDATHTYEEVRDNILEAIPLMTPGGVICGDDRHHYPVAKAVVDVFGYFEYDANLWWRRVGDGD